MLHIKTFHFALCSPPLARGDIVLPKIVSQDDYELTLYRWVKKNWNSNKTQFLDLKQITQFVEGNESLVDHFHIDVEELSKDFEENDKKLQKKLHYSKIFEVLEKRLKDLMAEKRAMQLAKAKPSADPDGLDASGANANRPNSKSKKKRSKSPPKKKHQS